MHVRSSTFSGRADKVKEMEAHLKIIKPMLAAIPGVISIHTAWNDDGQGTVFAVYENKEKANAASAAIQGVWSKMAAFLAAPPTLSEFSNVVKLV